MQFAPPIIAARKRAGLSQRDLAREVGVSPRAVWLIENGGGTIKVLDRLRIGVTSQPLARDLARIRAAPLKRGWSRQELAPVHLSNAIPAFIRRSCAPCGWSTRRI